MARSDFKFSFGFRVRYSETDMQGIVFNSHYLTYFDTAITEYVRWLEYDLQWHMEELGQDFHTVHVDMDFYSPCRFDDELDVCVRVSKLGNSSLTFRVEIFLKGQEELRTSGQIVWANAHQKEHKSRPLPQELVDMIKLRQA
jgi:acyl-CoA thioester hydrolase